MPYLELKYATLNSVCLIILSHFFLGFISMYGTSIFGASSYFSPYSFSRILMWNNFEKNIFVTRRMLPKKYAFIDHRLCAVKKKYLSRFNILRTSFRNLIFPSARAIYPMPLNEKIIPSK